MLIRNYEIFLLNIFASHHKCSFRAYTIFKLIFRCIYTTWRHHFRENFSKGMLFNIEPKLLKKKNLQTQHFQMNVFEHLWTPSNLFKLLSLWSWGNGSDWLINGLLISGVIQHPPKRSNKDLMFLAIIFFWSWIRYQRSPSLTMIIGPTFVWKCETALIMSSWFNTSPPSK